MSRLDLHAHIGAPIDLVYRVVADVERYPEFLPDVIAVERQDDIVSMTVRMGLVPVKLVSRATFTPPEAIDLAQVEGPFRRFGARWTFTPRLDGTAVRYEAEYELPLVGSLFGGAASYLLEQQIQRQIRAFESRTLGLAQGESRPAEGSSARLRAERS